MRGGKLLTKDTIYQHCIESLFLKPRRIIKERYAAFKVTEDRLDCFLGELLHSQKEYEDL